MNDSFMQPPPYSTLLVQPPPTTTTVVAVLHATDPLVGTTVVAAAARLNNLREICRCVEIGIFGVSLLSNCALIALIARERSQGIKAYGRVLLLTCAFDLVNSVFAFAAQMQMEFADGYLIFVVDSPLKVLPLRWHYLLQYLHLFGIACSVHIVGIMFYFRYQLVCRNKALGTLALAKIVALPVAYSLLECACFFMAFSTESAVANRAQVCERLLVGPVWAQASADAQNCLFTHISNRWLLLLFAMCCVIHSGVYALMVWCSRTVLRELRANRCQFSTKTAAMHQQLNLMLFVQMAAPMFTVFAPSVLFFAFIFARLPVRGVGLFVSMAFSANSLNSPLITLAFVGAFRRKIAHILAAPRRQRRSQRQSAATTKKIAAAVVLVVSNNTNNTQPCTK